MRTPIRVYERNLRTILAFLKQHADRVVFGLTTPVPLLLSTKGRWVWCEDAFRYTVRSGVLPVETGHLAPAPRRTCAPIQTGVAARGTLRAAFEHCSRKFFPPKGHPRLEFFREPIGLNSSEWDCTERRTEGENVSLSNI